MNKTLAAVILDSMARNEDAKVAECYEFGLSAMAEVHKERAQAARLAARVLRRGRSGYEDG